MRISHSQKLVHLPEPEVSQGPVCTIDHHTQWAASGEAAEQAVQKMIKRYMIHVQVSISVGLGKLVKEEGKAGQARAGQGPAGQGKEGKGRAGSLHLSPAI